ncbi:uncharacterized protein F4817DRAFT_343281 [Daldinia loculata]|uniref:uncharacterized protein n=1 Tax=Daldinia loculata TaxID=103429 RepID=UPI0020C3E77F|nr:uncharacterized protein F4817DRAFT_343281 [Daldinia loculata]KAI1645639.1 hypothetical protein F4817DRAFT_343281 [Daldinia loculata]
MYYHLFSFFFFFFFFFWRVRIPMQRLYRPCCHGFGEGYPEAGCKPELACFGGWFPWHFAVWFFASLVNIVVSYVVLL